MDYLDPADVLRLRSGFLVIFHIMESAAPGSGQPLIRRDVLRLGDSVPARREIKHSKACGSMEVGLSRLVQTVSLSFQRWSSVNDV